MISRSPESMLSDFLFNKEISCVLLVGTGRLPLKTKKPWDVLEIRMILSC